MLGFDRPNGFQLRLSFSPCTIRSMATSILEQIIKPTQEINGIRYFNGEGALFLAAALSDFGRDYEIYAPVTGSDFSTRQKPSKATAEIYAGRWTPVELEDRLKRLKQDFPRLALMAAGENSHSFEYTDPRVEGEISYYDPLSGYTDLPEDAVVRIGAAHYSILRKLLKRMMTAPGFLGRVGERLNGLDLTYFDYQYISPRGNYPGDVGSYIYHFFDEDKHAVAWKTGKSVDFKRDGLYTVIGGSVKAHDSYPGQPPKTMLTRAKFFDHETSGKIG